jgi:hypothetical protein
MDRGIQDRRSDPTALGELAFDLICRTVGVMRDTAARPDEANGTDEANAANDGEPVKRGHATRPVLLILTDRMT